MTIHASKGLVQRLSACRGGMRACSRCPTQKASVLTGFRGGAALAYVALARARDQAVITWAQSRMHHGRTLPGPSRFIAEIAGEGVQGYAHHPLDGRKLYGLTTPSQPARPTSSYDEQARMTTGTAKGASTRPVTP